MVGRSSGFDDLSGCFDPIYSSSDSLDLSPLSQYVGLHPDQGGFYGGFLEFSLNTRI